MNKIVFLAAAVLSLTACGTTNTVVRDQYIAVRNLKEVSTYCQSIPRVYSGVAYDFCKLHAKPVRVHDEGLSKIDGVTSVPFAFLDMLICIATDTLALPYTIHQQYHYDNIELD